MTLKEIREFFNEFDLDSCPNVGWQFQDSAVGPKIIISLNVYAKLSNGELKKVIAYDNRHRWSGERPIRVEAYGWVGLIVINSLFSLEKLLQDVWS